MEKNHYVDLTRKPDGFKLPGSSSFYYLIYSLEIILSDSTDVCLLINYNTYSLLDGRVKECIWAPPFFACHAPEPLLGVRDVAHVRKVFATLERTIQEDEEINRRLYLMGTFGADVEPLGEILEYKRSLTEPDRFKCYKIKRYAVTLSDELALLNLVDPENLKGHAFLPLNRLEDVVITHSAAAGYDYSYKGKPLASHLCRLIIDYQELPHWISRSISVPKELFQYKESGLLLRIDISGYGATCEYIRLNMRSFNEDGAAIEDWFNGTLYKTFLRLSSRYGLTRLRLEGDGFVAALPQHQFGTGQLQSAVEAILKMIEELRFALERLNSSIKDRERHIFCRAAIVLGEYYYGRIGELSSNGGELQGTGLTIVTRFEQALREFRNVYQNSKEQNNTIALSGLDPNLILHPTVFEAVTAKMSVLGITKVQELELHIKEFEGVGFICCQRRPNP